MKTFSRITHHASRFLPILLTFLILVPTLDAQSLWWDEGISLHLATSSWAEIISNRAANIHPPLYFFALKVWVGLAGRTPFAARYLSALATILLPAAVYAFVWRRFGRRTARCAAFLVALAPPFIIYGQEARAYAFLPLMVIALLVWVWPVGRATATATARASLRVAVVQTVFVLTHYIGVVAVVWVNLVRLVQLVRRRERRVWQRWALTVGLTALLLLPWGLAVLSFRAVGLRTEAGLGNATAEPLPLDYLARLLGIFHTTGLPAAMADPLLARPSMVTGVLLVIALLWSLLGGKARFGNRGYLLVAWLLPLLSATAIWIFSPQAHPRYVLPFVLGGWLLAAALVATRSVPRWLRGGLLAAVLTTSILGLYVYFTNPAYSRSDVRGVAAYIREQAAPGDVALVPHTDWSLEQYGLGAARAVMMPGPADSEAVAAMLAREMQPNSHVYLLDYNRDALDPRDQVRAALEWGGWLEYRRDFHGVFVQRYVVNSAITTPECTPIPRMCVDGQIPCLIGVAFQPNPESGGALPVHLCWEGEPGDATRYAVALRLYAQSGALVAATDGPLTRADHLLLLPVGLLPHAYRLEAGVYTVDDPTKPVTLVREGQPPSPAVALGDVMPVITPWLDASPYGLSTGLTVLDVAVLPGLQVRGAAIDRDVVYPGQRFYVMLRWDVTAAEAVVEGQRLVMRQDGRDLAFVELLEGLPLLPEGRPLVEHAALTVPPDAEEGLASLVLVAGEREIAIGDMTLRVGEHTFGAPPVAYPVGTTVGEVATLVGIDVEPGLAVRSGDPLTVTLVWRAEANAANSDLTVFTHLVGEDGGIVAQHDGKPVGGLRSTSGWLAGEIVVDVHTLVWQREYSGPARLYVGLYDAATGVRVLWADGRDAWTFGEVLDVR